MTEKTHFSLFTCTELWPCTEAAQSVQEQNNFSEVACLSASVCPVNKPKLCHHRKHVWAAIFKFRHWFSRSGLWIDHSNTWEWFDPSHAHVALALPSALLSSRKLNLYFFLVSTNFSFNIPRPRCQKPSAQRTVCHVLWVWILWQGTQNQSTN